MSAPHRPSSFRTTGGFTLVELLVVITIIAVLAAMITPAYFAVRRSVFETGVASDLSQVELALDRFKDEFGFYPPDFSEFVDANGDPLDLGDLIPNFVPPTTVEQRMLQFLAKISPTHNELALDPFDPMETRLEHWWHSVAEPMIVDMTAAGAATKDNRLRGPQHALWFWLSQLHNDAQYPISGQRLNNTTGSDVNANGVDDTLDIVSERRVFFEFPGALLVERTNIAVEYPAPGISYPIYVPIQRGGDGPLVYFHNDTYIENTSNDPSIATVINYDPAAVFPAPLNIAKPVRVPGSALPDGSFLQAKRYQIVAAGSDERFGEVDAGTYEALDNICSFSEGRLDGFVTRYENP